MFSEHISYQKNPWTSEKKYEMANSEINIASLCADSDEIQMFRSESLKNLIEFKWNSFGFRFHLVGTIVHIIYMAFLFVYCQ